MNVNPGKEAARAQIVGGFVLSLDFELMWGVRDQTTRERYGANILGARQIIPRLLELFSRRQIACTWATVGLLFFSHKDDMEAALPEVRPIYRDRRLSPYPYMARVGRSESTDPYHYGLSLIRQIMDAPGQEIGSHTFSHYYCLEEGQTLEAFQADLAAAISVASKLGLNLKSMVFPRNQYSSRHVDLCRAADILAYRGTEQHPMYRATAQSGVTKARRAIRLLDSYLNLTGYHASVPSPNGGVVDIPSSRFLRPYNGRLTVMEPLRLDRILKAMRFSAASNSTYHLWFHPHNFGINQDANIVALERIVDEFERLRDRFSWQSFTMADLAKALRQ
jgi:peptidoglycan/xylan/chitin deacetylase (PgdA/CDA1 family)